jgi:hypothetical protein
VLTIEKSILKLAPKRPQTQPTVVAGSAVEKGWKRLKRLHHKELNKAVSTTSLQLLSQTKKPWSLDCSACPLDLQYLHQLQTGNIG